MSGSGASGCPRSSRDARPRREERGDGPHPAGRRTSGGAVTADPAAIGRGGVALKPRSSEASSGRWGGPTCTNGCGAGCWDLGRTGRAGRRCGCSDWWICGGPAVRPRRVPTRCGSCCSTPTAWAAPSARCSTSPDNWRTATTWKSSAWSARGATPFLLPGVAVASWTTVSERKGGAAAVAIAEQAGAVDRARLPALLALDRPRAGALHALADRRSADRDPARSEPVRRPLRPTGDHHRRPGARNLAAPPARSAESSCAGTAGWTRS